MGKKGATLGDRMFYSVTSRQLREDDRELLAQVRRAYFEKGTPQHGRTAAETFGADDTAKYRITRHSMKWELTSGGRTLQRAVPAGEGGYAVLTWDGAGDLREKAGFDRRHIWLRSAFYRGNPKRPELLLEPEGEELNCLRYDDRIGKYRRTRLFPYPREKTDTARIWMDNEAGTPDIEADTSDGRFYYCTKQELAARKAAAARRDNAEAEDVPSWDTTPAVPIQFQFVRNEHVLDEATAPQPNLELESEDGPLLLEVEEPHFLPVLDLEDCIVDTELPDEPAVIEEDVAPVPVVFQPAKVSAAPAPQEELPRIEEKADALHPDKYIKVSETESYLYFGALQDGKRQGQGRTQMQSGHTAYEGGFAGDKRDGFGTYYYKSGRLCYAGNWQQNQRSGLGVSFSARDGSLFVGQWENNTPTGLGTAFDSDGVLSYYGMWLDGRRDGHGTEYFNGKVLYEGAFRNDCYNGQGCLHLSEGGTLTGTFRSGFADGSCEERDAAGKTVRTGVWQHGEFVSGVCYRDGKPAEIVVKKDEN